MTENNPYQAPDADVSEPEIASGELAGRGTRLLAVIVDALIGAALGIPLFMALGLFELGQQPTLIDGLRNTLIGYALFIAVHTWFLKENGQTIGKKLLHIKIVRSDGSQPSLGDLLGKRYLFMTLIAAIPFIGGLVALGNVLMIFRADRRCGHDLVADTKVVRA